MAIFHLDLKLLSRGKGRSATAATAYRSGELIEDKRTGEVHDYGRRRGVAHTEIFVPEGAPAWARDRAALWNAAEMAEKRQDALVAREVVIALPHELTGEQRQEAAENFSRWLVERHGVAVDLAIHEPHRAGDERNHHAHLLVSTRRLEAEGFGKKTRELDELRTGREHVTAWRKEWEAELNRGLERAGVEARVDSRSHGEKGDDREALLHLGPEATGMERRGERSRIGEENRSRAARNAERGERPPREAGPTPEPSGPDKARITELWRGADGGAAFAAALEAEGLKLCQGDRRPFVILDAEGKAYGAARLIEGARTAELRERLEGVPLPTVREALREMEGHRAALAEKEREATRAEARREVTERREPVAAPRGPEKATDASTVRGVARMADRAAGKTLHVTAAVMGKPAEKLTDFVAGLFEGLLGAPPKKPRTFTAGELVASAEARREQRLQTLARQERDEALDHMAEAIRAGKNLDRGDVRKLGLDDLEGIRAHGDAHVEKLVREREAERQRERLRSQGRERERER